MARNEKNTLLEIVQPIETLYENLNLNNKLNYKPPKLTLLLMNDFIQGGSQRMVETSSGALS